jgi:hypothetical protein
MNRVIIWCPYCKGYQDLKYSKRMWQVMGCGQFLCDAKGQYINGFEGLAAALKAGAWMVRMILRKPGDDEPKPKTKPKLEVRKASQKEIQNWWESLSKLKPISPLDL